MVAMSRPINPAMMPFSGESVDRVDMIVKPNNAMAKYSGVLKVRAILAINGATVTNNDQLIMRPMNEAIMAMPIAFPAKPFLARGYPSKVVAVAAGVPGVLMRTAGMEPP